MKKLLMIAFSACMAIAADSALANADDVKLDGMQKDGASNAPNVNTIDNTSTKTKKYWKKKMRKHSTTPAATDTHSLDGMDKDHKGQN